MHSETLLKQDRIDLAAAFRWAARWDMHESIANHFSLAVSEGGKQFLLNPVGSHFSRIRASDLLLLDADQGDQDITALGADPTAWNLHAMLHQRLPQARCILHTHMPYATTLCCLQDFEWLALDQNACRFYGRIAYDRDYAGMARAFGLHAERVTEPGRLEAAIREAFDKAPALIDVVTTQDALSSDAGKGLGWVPDRQALTAWDEAEQQRRV